MNRKTDLEILDSAAEGHKVATNRLRKAALAVADEVEGATVPRVLDTWDGWTVEVSHFRSQHGGTDFVTLSKGSEQECGYRDEQSDSFTLCSRGGYLHGDFNAVELEVPTREQLVTFAQWVLSGGIKRFAAKLERETAEMDVLSVQIQTAAAA